MSIDNYLGFCSTPQKPPRTASGPQASTVHRATSPVSSEEFSAVESTGYPHPERGGVWAVGACASSCRRNGRREETTVIYNLTQDYLSTSV